MNENAIEAFDLQKTYTDHWFSSRKYEALRGITFTVPRGKIFGLLGPNGAGKTTFVKIMLGIVSKTMGQAKVLGSAAGSKLARTHIGYLPENLRMRRHHTANSALEFYGGLSGLPVNTVKTRRTALLKKVGLESWADQGIKKYSKGMLQRLGLAQALLHDPDLLILDEPTDGLDPQARAEVREIMLDLKQEGKTIFLNSHILQEVELVCDSVAILDLGKLKYCGPVKEISQFIAEQTGIRSGGGITFVLGATAAVVHPLLSISQADSITSRPDGNCEFYSERTEVDFVNQCIDQLRANGISILEINRNNVSLEDAFLTLLAKPGDGGKEAQA